jgi:transposase
MEYGAIDLHSQRSLIRIVDADGAVLLDRTVASRREGFMGVFADRARMRVLLESGTESEWVAATLEACGHEVIVADPNYALMYGARGRAVKTDRRDVAALAEACRLGIYRRAHRVSAAQREVRRVRIAKPNDGEKRLVCAGVFANELQRLIGRDVGAVALKLLRHAVAAEHRVEVVEVVRRHPFVEPELAR